MEWTERLLKTLENKHYAKSIHFPWTRPEADQYFYLALSEQHSLSSTALKHLVSKKMNGWITVNPDIYHLFSLPDCTLQHQNTCFIIIFFDYTMVRFILLHLLLFFFVFIEHADGFLHFGLLTINLPLQHLVSISFTALWKLQRLSVAWNW